MLINTEYILINAKEMNLDSPNRDWIKKIQNIGSIVDGMSSEQNTKGSMPVITNLVEQREKKLSKSTYVSPAK